MQTRNMVDSENCDKYAEKYILCLKSANNSPDKIVKCQEQLKFYEYCLIKKEVQIK